MLSDFIKNSNRSTLITAAIGGVAATAGLLLLKHLYNRPSLPPGPIGLPLFGRLLNINKDTYHLDLQAASQKYGPISSMYIGTSLWVIISDYNIARQMLNLQVYSGRLSDSFLQNVTQGCGIIFTHGETWITQRRLSHQYLREFGLVKSLSGNKIQDEIEGLVDNFKKLSKKKDGVKVIEEVSEFTNNVIAGITFCSTRRDPASKQESKKMTEIFQEYLKSNINLCPLVIFPFLSKLSWIVDKLPGTKDMKEKLRVLDDFTMRLINNRKALMVSEDTEPLCLCDAYILEQRKAEKAGDFETFKDYELLRVCLELVFAGTDSTARTLEWMLVYMACYPSVQEKVHKEIYSTLGLAGKVQMSDKSRLNYSMAVIEEVSRMASMAALALPHRALQDTVFHGYRIPKDSIIFTHVYAIHRSPHYFKNPNEFNPNRFLDNEGQFHLDPHVTPFNIGKRSCVGESLARMEIFLAFVTLMQLFKIELHADCINKRDEILAGRMKEILEAHNYKVIISNR